MGRSAPYEAWLWESETSTYSQWIYIGSDSWSCFGTIFSDVQGYAWRGSSDLLQRWLVIKQTQVGSVQGKRLFYWHLSSVLSGFNEKCLRICCKILMCWNVLLAVSLHFQFYKLVVIQQYSFLQQTWYFLVDLCILKGFLCWPGFGFCPQGDWEGLI